MAINQAIQPLTISLLPQTAARVTNLTRKVVDAGTGVAGAVTASYGATIHPTTTVYEVDSNNNEIAIYESADLPAFDVAPSQMAQLMEVQVTLIDGTVTTVGNLIANWEDQVINSQLALGGVITTPMVNLNPTAPATS